MESTLNPSQPIMDFDICMGIGPQRTILSAHSATFSQALQNSRNHDQNGFQYAMEEKQFFTDDWAGCICHFTCEDCRFFQDSGFSVDDSTPGEAVHIAETYSLTEDELNTFDPITDMLGANKVEVERHVQDDGSSLQNIALSSLALSTRSTQMSGGFDEFGKPSDNEFLNSDKNLPALVGAAILKKRRENNRSKDQDCKMTRQRDAANATLKSMNRKLKNGGRIKRPKATKNAGINTVRTKEPEMSEAPI